MIRLDRQLYLRFPPVAGHPAALLKGFQKTRVLAAAPETVEERSVAMSAQTVTFRLTLRDRSYYDAASSKWVAVDGRELQALIGASSADIRQRLPLQGA